MRIESFAFALEDVFSLYLNDFNPGFFVDIGCGHPRIGSNSKLLELVGWKGICIDVAKHRDWDSERTTRCHTADATTVAYPSLLRQEIAPFVIDALFIDVDDACYDVLNAIPFNYEYKVLTIEHDYYRTSKLRNAERELLARRGYELVCADVLHEPDKPFEDWWIRSRYFDPELIDRIRSCSELDIGIVRKFGHSNTILRRHGFNGLYPQLEIA